MNSLDHHDRGCPYGYVTVTLNANGVGTELSCGPECLATPPSPIISAGYRGQSLLSSEQAPLLRWGLASGRSCADFADAAAQSAEHVRAKTAWLKAKAHRMTATLEYQMYMNGATTRADDSKRLRVVDEPNVGRSRPVGSHPWHRSRHLTGGRCAGPRHRPAIRYIWKYRFDLTRDVR
jgi:hypothetical protein